MTDASPAPKNIPFPSQIDHSDSETRCDVCRTWTSNPSRCDDCAAAGLTPSDRLTEGCVSLAVLLALAVGVLTGVLISVGYVFNDAAFWTGVVLVIAWVMLRSGLMSEKIEWYA